MGRTLLLPGTGPNYVSEVRMAIGGPAERGLVERSTGSARVGPARGTASERACRVAANSPPQVPVGLDRLLD